MSRRDRSKLNKGFGAMPEPVSKEEIDLTLYGAGDIAALDSSRRDAVPQDIFTIYPDMTQPRRVVPSEIRHRWDGNPAGISDVFAAWVEAITLERASRLPKSLPDDERQALAFMDVGAYLEGTYLNQVDDDEAEFVPGPIEAGFQQVLQLAATIRRDGLINPITIAHAGVDYRLETGERRWLAYHLLYAFYDGSDGRPDEQKQWQRIPAYVVDEASVWRMAHENNVRDDLNAIGKARQFALLLMTLYADQYAFTPFQDLVEPGDCDRMYYAQVADGKQFPMPRGESEKLLNAMGFTSKSQLREHRSLLALPDEVWQWADDLNWAQRRIRDMRRQANGDDELLVRLAQREAAKAGLSVGTPTHTHIPGNPNATPALPPDGPHRRGKILISRQNRAKIRHLMALRGGAGQLGKKEKRKLRDDIAIARNWLEQLEQTLAEDE